MNKLIKAIKNLFFKNLPIKLLALFIAAITVLFINL